MEISRRLDQLFEVFLNISAQLQIIPDHLILKDDIFGFEILEKWLVEPDFAHFEVLKILELLGGLITGNKGGLFRDFFGEVAHFFENLGALFLLFFELFERLDVLDVLFQDLFPFDSRLRHENLKMPDQVFVVGFAPGELFRDVLDQFLDSRVFALCLFYEVFDWGQYFHLVLRRNLDQRPIQLLNHLDQGEVSRNLVFGLIGSYFLAERALDLSLFEKLP